MKDKLLRKVALETVDKQVSKLLNEFSSPKKLNKKQVSIFLPKEILDKLDDITNEVNNYTERTVSRNNLIEIAVQSLIESYPLALNDYKQKYSEEDADDYFDTAVFPSYYSGIETLLSENKWYYVRINEKNISKIKYIALYLGSPIKKITHYAEVKGKPEKVLIKGKPKYIFYVGKITKLKKPIPLGSANPVGTRSTKYTTLKKLLNAQEYSDLD